MSWAKQRLEMTRKFHWIFWQWSSWRPTDDWHANWILETCSANVRAKIVRREMTLSQWRCKEIDGSLQKFLVTLELCMRRQWFMCVPIVQPYIVQPDTMPNFFDFLHTAVENQHFKRRFLDRVWLGTVCKRFSNFTENFYINVFWAETAKNLVKTFKKNFRREIWREIWFFVFEKENQTITLSKLGQI